MTKPSSINRSLSSYELFYVKNRKIQTESEPYASYVSDSTNLGYLADVFLDSSTRFVIGWIFYSPSIVLLVVDLGHIGGEQLTASSRKFSAA